jgi:hypothetical protein
MSYGHKHTDVHKWLNGTDRRQAQKDDGATTTLLHYIMHTYIHTYIQTYIYTDIHRTYIQGLSPVLATTAQVELNPYLVTKYCATLPWHDVM